MSFVIPIDDIAYDVEESHNSQVKVPNLRIKVDHTPGKDYVIIGMGID